MISRLLTLALSAASLLGQTHPVESAGRQVSLVVGRGQLFRFAADIKQVAAAEPKIADVVVISPREVMINAKAVGRTTVIMWEGAGEPNRYDVVVLPDTFEFDEFRDQLRREFAAPALEVTGKGDTIVLTGSVASSAQAKVAAGLAQSRARTVVNLLKFPADPEPRQILLQVRFASIDRTALTQIGFNLFSLNGKFQGLTSTQQFTAPKFNQVQGASANNSVNFSDLLNLFVYRPDMNIGATIKALQDNNLLQILAEPNLITLEGREASFLAGGSFPFPVLTTTSTGGSTSPVVTVQFKPFGVQLNFTPTITSTGAIDLKVSPEVSTLDFVNAVTVAGILIPALSQKKVDTEVILREGESFAIAGLIDNRVQQEAEKLIGLGSIPILGQLFRTRQTQKTTTELLVVITPRIVHALSPEEKAKLPDFVVPFQKTVQQETHKKGKKNADLPQPEFVGPRGHQEPTSKPPQ